MQNQIILQGTTPEALINQFSEVLNFQIEKFKKELQSKSLNDELLSREQTCKFLQIDSSTLWHWTNKGKVKCYGISNRRYYKRSELIESLILLKK